jgi:hypothetical protein
MFIMWYVTTLIQTGGILKIRWSNSQPTEPIWRTTLIATVNFYLVIMPSQFVLDRIVDRFAGRGNVNES